MFERFESQGVSALHMPSSHQSKSNSFLLWQRKISARCAHHFSRISRSLMRALSMSQLQYKYANHSSPNYVTDGEGSVSFRLIKQRADFAFGFFSGDITNVGFLIPTLCIVSFLTWVPAYAIVHGYKGAQRLVPSVMLCDFVKEIIVEILECSCHLKYSNFFDILCCTLETRVWYSSMLFKLLLALNYSVSLDSKLCMLGDVDTVT